MGDEAHTIIRTLVNLSSYREGQAAMWPACARLVKALQEVALDARSGHCDVSIGETERGWEYSGIIESDFKHGKDRPFLLILTTQ